MEHCVSQQLLTYVLAVFLWVIKDLVFPHIEIENHDEKNDAIIEPFSRNLNFYRFNTDGLFVQTGQVDVQCIGEMWKVPILHDNQKVQNENSGAQKGTRELYN